MKRICFLLAIIFVVTSPTFAAPKKPKPKMVKAKPPTDKPDVTQLEPRGIQRGVETKIKLTGTNLADLVQLKSFSPKLKGELIPTEEKNTETFIKLTAGEDLIRGAYEFSLINSNGESGRIKIYVDDLPQVSEDEKVSPRSVKLPVTFWGAFDKPGDSDEIEFEAKTGENLVFDSSAKSIGSKAGVVLELFDAKGSLVASSSSFDGGDPLFAFKVPAAEKYRLRLHEQMAAASNEHFYRVSIGEFPVVAGIFPLGVIAKTEMEIELAGFNLPPHRVVKIKTDKPGEMDVPIDLEKFRSRKTFKVTVTESSESVESEPNNSPGQATKLTVPGIVDGRISPSGDVDLFRFTAKSGADLVIKTISVKHGSPVDTKIEILHADGRPVERVLLQAVRDSSITFRPIDSNTDDLRVENWREMELTQFLYMQGEVGKIFRMPQGPDSGFQLFSRGGKRRCYFDTSGMAHALDEPCYIVEPHPPRTKLVPNGLPVFTIFYANDDDGERKLGTDSSVHFVVPADGDYLVRVSDTRGHGGERFAYRLVVREAKPDFNVTLPTAIPTVAPGSGQDFVLTADRTDDFDGDITVEISGLPEGFTCSSPIVIQAGHLTASGTVNANADAKEPKESQVKITATALVAGKKVMKDLSAFGTIKLGEKPKLLVALEPYDEANTNFVERAVSEKPLEITIAPGQSIPAWLKVKRDGHDDLVTFSVDNLPHGVIVDNIGLSGVLIPKGDNERQIFLTAARWVPDADRLVYAQAKQAGNPTSLPVLLHVRKAAGSAVASKP